MTAITYTVSSGQTSSGLTLFEDTLIVLSGGFASNTSGVDGAAVTVSAGGSAVGTTLTVASTLVVYAGGIITGTDIDQSSVTLSGGEAIGTILETPLYETYDSGTETVLSGGLALRPIVSVGGEIASAGGVVSGATLGYAGTEILRAGGSGLAAIAAVSGAAILVSAGGVTSADMIASGGVETVSAGGTADTAGISAGGEFVVSSGGTASGLAVASGGLVVLQTGATLTGGSIAAGGELLILSGSLVQGVSAAPGSTVLSTGVAIISGATLVSASSGTLSGAVVSAGGSGYVLSGGTAVRADLLYGAALEVQSGGVASGTYGNNGVLTIDAGATASNTGYTLTVYDYGTTIGDSIAAGNAVSGEIVESGGVALAAQVNVQNATLTISSGGRTSGTVLSRIAPEFTGFVQEIVDSGATTTGTSVVTSGFEVVYGTASSVMVSSGGEAFAGSGGTLLSSTVSSGGRQVVYGGTSISATVSAGGQEVVSVGGTASFAIVLSGGEQIALAGGIAVGTVVSSGGILLVSSGGTESGAHLLSGAGAIVLPGGTLSGVVADPGSVVASGSVILFSGTEIVSASDATNGLAVGSGETADVFAGGVISATSIASAGAVIVSSGGTSISATVATGGAISGLLGASLSGTVVDGGLVSVSSGSVVNTTVNAGSVTLEFTTQSGTVVAGGVEVAEFYGTMSGVTVTGSGILSTYFESATSTTVGGGGEFVVSALSTQNTTILSGGVVSALASVDNLTYVTSTTIDGGGLEVVSGARVFESAALVSSGGLLILDGATETGADLRSGATLIDFDATVGGTVAEAGSLVLSTGVAVVSGAVVQTYTSSALVGATLSGANEAAYVLVGGTVLGTSASSGATVFVGVSGVASSTTVGLGGQQAVISGGSAIGTIVLSGGTEAVDAASATDTMLQSGATESLTDGATMQGASVDGGATLYVIAGSTDYDTGQGSDTEAVNTSVESGGLIWVYGFDQAHLADATDTVIQSGGVMRLGFVNAEDQPAPGYASGTVLEQGGSLDLSLVNYNAGDVATIDPNTGLVMVVDSSGTVLTTPISGSVYLTGNYTGERLVTSPGNVYNEDFGTHTGTLLTLESVACYCPGTLIETDRGDVAVEALAIGDTVVTASGQRRPIRWIGRRSYGGAFAANNPDILPVLFRAGSLGEGLPRRDLWVSPLHAMFVDGALIPARLLANGVSIVQAERVEQVEYVHVELDSHDLLLAEGAPSESFVDDNSRGMFHNAAEYRVLYPDAARVPGRYCAPRLEDGEALDAVQRRLAALACPMAGPGALRGYLDTAGPDTVTGWARNLDAPDERVVLRVVVNGAVLGEVVADQERLDLRAVNEGDGRHAFSFTIPGGLTLGRRHLVEVQRAADGQDLRNSPMVVEPAALTLPTAPVPPTPLAGTLDHCDRNRLVGWAWQPGTDAPVALQVLDNGVPLVRILANLHRPDLKPAGIGNGRHGFDITMPGGLSPLARHMLEIRRESDGAALPGTPVVIEPAHSFDPALEGAVERAVAALDADGEQDRVLSFLVAQTERLLQRRATAASGTAERQAVARFRRRWGPAADTMADAPVDVGPRVLVIDSRLPAQGRDAGSEALLSHMQALQALGYTVSVTAADDLAGSDAALAGMGISCLGLPAYASVEDVLRRNAGCFDLVYLHRAPVASHYLQLARRHQPRARVVYSVADLHHVRMARQAAVEDRPELLAASRTMRVMECAAAWSADAVITHSAEEAALLRDAVPGASVHVVPWAVPVTPAGSGKRRPRFADRAGVAFIGHGAHAPNADAASWLVEEVMPLVWQADPAIGCVLAGSALPERVRSLAGPGVTVLGHVPDLRTVFDRVRLTVAPLRFGAGVKGKVLTSLAARTPCIMTPVAAEGLGLPPVLRDLVAQDAAGLASLIIRLHGDEARVRAAARAGAEFMRRTCSEDAVTAAMDAAVDSQAKRSTRRAG